MSLSAPHEPVATRATTLLLNIAAGDESQVHEYYTLLFDFLWKVAVRRGRFLAAEAAHRLGIAKASSSGVQSSDIDMVAFDAAVLALQRAVAAATRFDPARGDGASWALGALGTAYYDTIRQHTGARRLLREIPSSDYDLEAGDSVPSPELQVEARDGLDRALALLTEHERTVIVAHLHYGMSYREIAADHFNDEKATKRVDALLQAARLKLRAAHHAWLNEP